MKTKLTLLEYSKLVKEYRDNSEIETLSRVSEYLHGAFFARKIYNKNKKIIGYHIKPEAYKNSTFNFAYINCAYKAFNVKGSLTRDKIALLNPHKRK